MAECIKRIATTKTEIRNENLPAPYNNWVDITPYIESDIDAGYDFSTVESKKSNSQIVEEYVSTIKTETSLEAKILAGTFFGEYLIAIDNFMNEIDLDILNCFAVRKTTPMQTLLYPLCTLKLAKEPFTNIADNEAMEEISFSANGKRIRTPNPLYIPKTSQISTVDINLVGVQAIIDQIDFTWEEEETVVDYNTLKLVIKDSGTEEIIEEIQVEKGGAFETTSGLYPTGDYIAEMTAGEVGYLNNRVIVGIAEITVT